MTRQPEQLLVEECASPIGPVLLATDEAGLLRALDFADCAGRMARLLQRHYGVLAPRPGLAPAPLREALRAYFARDFTALPAMSWATGGSAFQQAVWRALTLVPPGTTLSYAALAARLGRPTAARAVGAANGANPLAIIVPCHRLVGADGSLTGYAGGLERKRWLLRHEGALAA